NRALLPQKAVCQGLIFAHQSQQQMLGLDVRAPVLARLVACKKDYPARLLGIAFKHVSSFLPVGPCPSKSMPAEIRQSLCESAERRFPAPGSGHSVPPAPDCASRSTTS